MPGWNTSWTRLASHLHPQTHTYGQYIAADPHAREHIRPLIEARFEPRAPGISSAQHPHYLQ